VSYKRWLIAGIAVFVFSVLTGSIGMLWWLWSMTSGIPREPRVIMAGGSIPLPGMAYIALFMLLGAAAGVIIIAIGGVKAYRHGKERGRVQDKETAE